MTIGLARRSMLLGLLLGAVPLPASGFQPQPQASAPAAPARSLFLFLYSPGPAWIVGRPMSQQDLRPHGLYIGGLMREGRAFAGGGFVDRDGGMAIVRAADMDEARAMLEADPAIASGVFVAELHQWSPRFHGDGPLVENPR